MTRESILIYGGTFDPPHRAHIELPARAADLLGCAHLIYVPTSSNPLKSGTPTDAQHRLRMLRIALDRCTNCEICMLELFADGPSYTVDTLARLRDSCDEDRGLRLLIGSDAALSFHLWREPQRILTLATPAVMLRPPLDRTEFADRLAEHWSNEQVDDWLQWTLDLPMMDIDATSLRERIARGEDVSDEVDPQVIEYIREHRVYVER